MNQKIWIARHAERQDFVEPGWIHTSSRPLDPPLSETGRVQALELARHLGSSGITRIFCSPFLRVMETAEPVAECLDLPLCVEPGLAEALPELDSNPETMSIEECAQRFVRVRRDYRPLRTLGYPESEPAARRRAAETVRRLAAANPDETILCVTHASPLVGIVRALCPGTGTLHAPLCAVFILSLSEIGWRLAHGPDISFLREPELSLRHDYVDE